MRVWRDEATDVISLAVVPSCGPFLQCSTEAELQQSARSLAQQRGGGLIEAKVALPDRTVKLIYKRRPVRAYVYTGQLMMPGRDNCLVWTVVAEERGITGVREAVVTAEMWKAGELTIETYQGLWAQDPYDPTYQGVDRSVLRSLSDDERYDERFSEHPLSKVRRVLAELPTSVATLP